MTIIFSSRFILSYFRRNGIMLNGQERNEIRANDRQNNSYDTSRDVNESQGSRAQTISNSSNAVPNSNINSQTMGQSFSSRLLQVKSIMKIRSFVFYLCQIYLIRMIQTNYKSLIDEEDCRSSN